MPLNLNCHLSHLLLILLASFEDICISRFFSCTTRVVVATSRAMPLPLPLPTSLTLQQMPQALEPLKPLRLRQRLTSRNQRLTSPHQRQLP